MPSKKPSLIAWNKKSKPEPEPDPSMTSPEGWDDFVKKDPGIATPSRPAPSEPQREESPDDRIISATYKLPKRMHKALRSAAMDMDKNVTDLVAEILTGYLDKHRPQWRD